MTKEWGQRNKTPILRSGWGLGVNHLGYSLRFCPVSAVSKAWGD